MGLISGIQALRAVQKIKKGGKARLSIAQITNLLINLPDAKQNMSPERFDEIYSLYLAHQAFAEKTLHDQYTYVEDAIQIIKRFNAIAPYEDYCGGDIDPELFVVLNGAD